MGVAGVIAMAAIPELSNQYFPNIAPALLHWFPNRGQQWVPIIGGVIAIIARVVSQQYVIDRLRAFFSRKPDDAK
jgi:hypothetical protein